VRPFLPGSRKSKGLDAAELKSLAARELMFDPIVVLGILHIAAQVCHIARTPVLKLLDGVAELDQFCAGDPLSFLASTSLDGSAQPRRPVIKRLPQSLPSSEPSC
jgi:hypothetical protein